MEEIVNLIVADEAAADISDKIKDVSPPISAFS